MAGHTFAQAFTHLARLLGAHARQHDDEFLTAVARQHIARPGVFAQQRSQRHEHAVADVVAVGVVHALEMVDVHQHQGHRFAVALQRGKQFGAATVEVATVAQAGERVTFGTGREFCRPRAMGLGVLAGLGRLPLPLTRSLSASQTPRTPAACDRLD